MSNKFQGNCEEYCKMLENRIEELEFRQDLLFYNTKVNRILFEYRITKSQYSDIMDVMDEFRKKIWEGNKEISHTKFEGKILSVLNRQDIDYHFCEYISQAFKEDSRWEEVFSTLYGDQLKYRG